LYDSQAECAVDSVTRSSLDGLGYGSTNARAVHQPDAKHSGAGCS